MFPQIKSLLLPLIILLATSSLLHSQTYFTQLPDATGYVDQLQAHQLDSLNAAACRLRAALPQEFQSDFAVYDLGFYRHHTSYEGGIPDIMQEAIDGLSTSYYLVFGREMNSDGELKKVWVEMELPGADFLSCLDQSQSSFHEHMVGTFVNDPAIIGKNDSYLYMKQLQAAFGYLKDVLAQLEDCCDHESGFRSLESCSHCSQDVQAFRSFMEANDFIGIEVEELAVTPYFDTTGHIREYTSASVDLEEETINVNDDVIGFLNRMDNAVEGIYGSLYYYDPLNEVICKQILKVVSGDYSLPVAIQGGGVSRSSPEEVVMDITTILTVDEDGGEMVHVKVDIPLQMTNTGKTIYLQCLDDCGFNMDSIRIYLENFYSLLGKYGAQVPLLPDFPNGPFTIDSVHLIPDIQVSTQKLTKEIVRDGVVVLFGDISKILESVADKYRFSLPPFLMEQDSAYIIEYLGNTIRPNWYNPGVLESAKDDYFAMVKSISNNNNLVNRWAASSTNHLAAFFTFHANGHNAGKRHISHQNVINYCQSYMSRGNTITHGYLGKPKPPFSIAWGGNCWELHREYPFSDLNSFVLETMKHPRYNHLKKNIYDRFFK